MEDFLLLGQVPGTNLVITFGMWLAVFNLVVGFALCWILITRRKQIELFVLKLRAGLNKHDELLKLDQFSL